MKSQSDPENLEKQVNSQLDAANNALPKSVKQDIAQARVRAVAQAKLNSQPPSALLNKLSVLLHRKWVLAAAPIMLVVLVLVNVIQSDTIPTLPIGLYSTDFPLEDLAMLEDLEFANWLAEQQEGLH